MQSQQTETQISEAELQAYIAARDEIAPITARYASMSAQERTPATAQIVEIQQRHNLTAARYDAIERGIQSDPELAQRAAGEGFTDAQLRAFAEASLEIDPISRQFAAAPPAEQQRLATEMRDILARYELDGSAYNAIASAAQTDAELAARIAALQVAAQADAAGSAE